MPTCRRDFSTPTAAPIQGWISFGIGGLAAVRAARVYADNVIVISWDLTAWGWTWLIYGLLEVLAFLRTGITNAGTEGTNWLVKQVLRAACGFHNTRHYRDRVRLHCARQASARATLPGIS